MALNPDKELKLYYSISEVAEMFQVNETLLRFWEKEFPQQIKPKKTGRNIRQYTKEDIEQIRTIYNLSAFMDGDIQDCIDHLIVAENAERLKESEL